MCSCSRECSWGCSEACSVCNSLACTLLARAIFRVNVASKHVAQCFSDLELHSMQVACQWAGCKVHTQPGAESNYYSDIGVMPSTQNRAMSKQGHYIWSCSSTITCPPLLNHSWSVGGSSSGLDPCSEWDGYGKNLLHPLHKKAFQYLLKTSRHTQAWLATSQCFSRCNCRTVGPAPKQW